MTAQQPPATGAADAGADPADMSDTVERWMTELSNWGRWGDDDQRGTLNLIGPDQVRAAMQLVSDGVVVSCAHEVRTGTLNAQRYMIGTGLGRETGSQSAGRSKSSDGGRSAVAAEFLGLIFHGMSITHIDAPSHVFWDGQMYNGAPASAVSDFHGATVNDVRGAAPGISTRGVLLDIAALLDVDALEPGFAIHPEHLDSACQQAGVELREGDCLLVRTGEAARRRSDRNYTGEIQPGLHASCLPWIHERDIAVLGSDVAQDVRPTGVHRFTMPIHTVGLVAMGLWLIDNCDLDELSRECSTRGRWEFQFTLAPLLVRGATGSPANPIAVF